MAIIALVGNKGGAGKTTLSVNLAAILAQHDATVVIDADPQGSAAQWRGLADSDNAPQVVSASENEGEDLDAQIQQLQQQFRYVIIDCPPSVHAPQTHIVLRYADLALIPVQPSPVDMWATIHIEKAIELALEKNPQLKTVMFINQLEPRTTLSRLVREALEEIDFPVAQTAIRRRAIYRASALEGKSVLQMGQRGAEAVNELDQLINEVILR